MCSSDLKGIGFFLHNSSIPNLSVLLPLCSFFSFSYFPRRAGSSFFPSVRFTLFFPRQSATPFFPRRTKRPGDLPVRETARPWFCLVVFLALLFILLCCLSCFDAGLALSLVLPYRSSCLISRLALSLVLPYCSSRFVTVLQCPPVPAPRSAPCSPDWKPGPLRCPWP